MSTDNTRIVIDMTEEVPPPAAGTPPVVVEEAGASVVVDERDDLADPLPDGATINDDGSISLTLRKTVTVVRRNASGDRQEVISELRFHRLSGADMRAIAAVNDINAQIVLLARSARMREAVMGKVFDAMDAADVVDAGQCVARFFGSGRKTGR